MLTNSNFFAKYSGFLLLRVDKMTKEIPLLTQNSVHHSRYHRLHHYSFERIGERAMCKKELWKHFKYERHNSYLSYLMI